jgi:hypothetical protein
LSLLHPSSSPPYHVFVARIIKSSDQQASIFLQQKLKVADVEERAKIVDAICARGFEMMAHRCVDDLTCSLPALKFHYSSTDLALATGPFNAASKLLLVPMNGERLFPACGTCCFFGFIQGYSNVVLKRTYRRVGDQLLRLPCPSKGLGL